MDPGQQNKDKLVLKTLFVVFICGLSLLSASAVPDVQTAVPEATPAPPLALDEQTARLEHFYWEIANAPDGRISVIVMLQGSPVKSRADLGAQEAEIAAVQDRVLSNLSTDEFEVIYQYPVIPGLAGWVTAPGLDKLAADPDVVSISPNLHGEAHTAQSVPFIGASMVQSYGFTGRGITVAVLDTGIDTDNVDLSDHIAAGAHTFVGGDQGAGAEDNNGHGTNVCGIITSKGTVVPVGVAPDAYILPVKVLNAGGGFQTSDVVFGINYVVNHVGDYDYLAAMNLSLGTDATFTACPCDNEPDLAALKAALQAAKNVGIAVFVSSGNKGLCGQMSAPACLSSVAAVAAVYDQDLGREPNDNTYGYAYGSNFGYCYDDPTFPDKIACFSNRSGCNKLAAPGRAIKSTKMGGGVDNIGWTGTSQAAPHCTAMAALIAEIGSRRFIAYSPDAIFDVMTTTGHATTDDCSATPHPKRIDCVAALAHEGAGPPCQMAKLVASDGAMNDIFGQSVAISGDVIVVGQVTPHSAYVFRRQGTTWVQEAKLTPNDPNSYNFGDTVGVSGNVIVVGDPWYAAPPSYSVGAAFVYRYNGASWIKEAKLMASDWAANDCFGTVAIDGNYIIVGAPQNDDASPSNTGCNSGSAYVFNYSGGSWSQVAKVTASDAACGDQFGGSVDIRGTRAVIGAYYATISGAQRGAAYIFDRTFLGTWVQQRKLTASDGAANDRFGYRVAVDGDVAVAGAHLDDNAGGADAGAAYVFRRDGSGNWPQEAKLTAVDAAANDQFGCSVAIRGNYIAVGAYRNDDAGSDSGSAYIFQRSGAASWWQRHKLTASDAAGNDNFGVAVALDGGRVVVGAYYDDTNRGSAYLFAVGLDCNNNGYPDECDITAGRSLDCNSNRIPDECDTIDNGDYNADDHVSFADFAVLDPALAGPANTPGVSPPACLGAALLAFDFDADTDIDLADFAPFQTAFTGS